jgi:Ca2+/Na+ antiporter
MDTFFSNEFLDMLVRFLICVLVVWIIIDRFYSAKSKRRDFYFTFMLISIAIFFIVFFMIFVLEDMKGKTSMGIGIGLFGIFSIMRYRTDSMPVREMTYLFVTICLSVVNALAVSMSYYELVATNIIFIISVWLCEKRLKLNPSKLIQYDRIELIKPERREELVENLKVHTDKVPNGDPELENLDHALASMAIREAVTRHAGTIEETYTMMGLTYVQSGKNLTKVKQIVVTGGSLIHTEQTEKIAAYAHFNPSEPASLRPKQADVWVDRTYILAAMGLLASHYPAAALRIMKKELEHHGYSE